MFQDLEVLKDIPGYKPILKAVLKSQIQMLVEQLAAHTEEESVLLTASVTDGSLCHLGSDSGKSFLDGHEEIKSQFLGHCLKRHQKRKADEAEVEAEAKRRQSFPAPYHAPHSHRPRQFGFQKRARSMGGSNAPRFSSPRQPHPVMLSKFSHKKVGGQSSKLPQSFPSSTQGEMINASVVSGHGIPTSVQETFTSGDSGAFQQPVKKTMIVKVEDQSGNIDSQNTATSQATEHSGVNSEINRTIDNQSEGRLVPGPSGTDSSEPSDTSGVKLEPLDDSDIDDLQITGVELANLSEGGQMSTDWSQNVMEYGASTSTAGEEYSEGAQSMDNRLPTREYTDMSDEHGEYVHQQQPPPNFYSFNTGAENSRTTIPTVVNSQFCDVESQSQPSSMDPSSIPLITSPSLYTDPNEHLYKLIDDKWCCVVCNRLFKRKDYVMKHVLVHTGEKPYGCKFCQRSFRQQSNLRVHIKKLHPEQYEWL